MGDVKVYQAVGANRVLYIALSERCSHRIDESAIKSISKLLAALVCGLLLVMALPAAAESLAEPSVQRGEYIYHMAGCASCHTNSDQEELGPAGNIPLDTPFGTFYTPNITPDRTTGIGGWTKPQFIAAMREGISPQGEHYFPAFPYTSYNRMRDPDLLDLKAYLDSLTPIQQQPREHDLSFPFDQRWLMGLWKALFFDREPLLPEKSRTEGWNRGAYIVNGPGHCVECHTPRNLLGGLKRDALLAGNPEGPEGGSVPAIDPAKSRSFRAWTAEDIVFSLQTGMQPDGDFLGGSMGHVIENSTSRLNDQDLKAIAEYLQSPVLRENGGFFASLFGSTDDAAEQGESSVHGQGVRLFDAAMGLILLTALGGVVWLVFRISGKRRAASNANRDQSKTSHHR